MQFFIRILREKFVFFKKITNHAAINFLQKYNKGFKLKRFYQNFNILSLIIILLKLSRNEEFTNRYEDNKNLNELINKRNITIKLVSILTFFDYNFLLTAKN